MTRKLPIAETAVDAGVFGIAHIVPVLRIAWLPVLVWIILLTVAGGLLTGGDPALNDAVIEQFRIDTGMPPFMSEDAVIALDAAVADVVAGLGWRLWVAATIVVLSSLVIVPIYTLVMRVAAGDETIPPGFLHWRWTRQDTRFVVVVILFSLVTSLIGWLLESVGLVIADGITGLGDLAIGWLAGLVPLAMTLLFLWISLRALLIPAAAAIEPQFRFSDALAATGGNVFRIIGSLALLYVMLLLAVIGFGLALMIGTLLLGLLTTPFGTESALGTVIGFLTTVAVIVLGAGFALGAQLTGVGWMGKAWAALRPGDTAPA